MFTLQWKVSENGSSIYAESAAVRKAVFGIARDVDGRFCVSSISKLFDVQPMPFPTQAQARTWCEGHEGLLLEKQSTPNPGPAGKESVMARDTEEHAVMFPELDDSPEHKKILKLAKSLKKIRDERKEALVQSKEKEDKIQEDLVAAMHEAKVIQFRHVANGTTIEAKIKPHSEKVAVKISAEDDEEEVEESDDE